MLDPEAVHHFDLIVTTLTMLTDYSFFEGGLLYCHWLHFRLSHFPEHQELNPVPLCGESQRIGSVA